MRGAVAILTGRGKSKTAMAALTCQSNRERFRAIYDTMINSIGNDDDKVPAPVYGRQSWLAVVCGAEARA